jgi:hypothetical protein
MGSSCTGRRARPSSCSNKQPWRCGPISRGWPARGRRRAFRARGGKASSRVVSQRDHDMGRRACLRLTPDSIPVTTAGWPRQPAGTGRSGTDERPQDPGPSGPRIHRPLATPPSSRAGGSSRPAPPEQSASKTTSPAGSGRGPGSSRRLRPPDRASPPGCSGWVRDGSPPNINDGRHPTRGYGVLTVDDPASRRPRDRRMARCGPTTHRAALTDNASRGNSLSQPTAHREDWWGGDAFGRRSVAYPATCRA